MGNPVRLSPNIQCFPVDPAPTSCETGRDRSGIVPRINPGGTEDEASPTLPCVRLPRV